EAEAGLLHGADHVEEEQRAHAVIAEALPHLREEERGQAAGMTEPLFLRDGCFQRCLLGNGNDETCSSFIVFLVLSSAFCGVGPEVKQFRPTRAAIMHNSLQMSSKERSVTLPNMRRDVPLARFTT